MPLKNNRLRSGEDFKVVFLNGRVSQGRLLKIKFVKNGKENSRFGFVIGLKFAKKASERNLMKRRLRMSAESLLNKVKMGYDIVVWPLTLAKKEKFLALAEELTELLKKNDLLSI